MNTKHIELARTEDLNKEEKELLQTSYNAEQVIKEDIKNKLVGLNSESAIGILSSVINSIERENKLSSVFKNDKTLDSMVNPALSFNFNHRF